MSLKEKQIKLRGLRRKLAKIHSQSAECQQAIRALSGEINDEIDLARADARADIDAKIFRLRNGGDSYAVIAHKVGLSTARVAQIYSRAYRAFGQAFFDEKTCECGQKGLDFGEFVERIPPGGHVQYREGGQCPNCRKLDFSPVQLSKVSNE